MDESKPFLKFTQHYNMGVGEQLWCSMMVLNTILHIKEKYPEIQTSFNILPSVTEVIEIIPEIYDTDYIKSITEFDVSWGETELQGNGDGDRFIRILSSRNFDMMPGIHGAYSIYTSKKHLSYITSLDLKLEEFEHAVLDDIKRPYVEIPIFNKKLVQQATDFKNAELLNEFETIFYRAEVPSNMKFMKEVISELENTIDLSKTYFVCSNSAYFKKEILDSKIKTKMFRGLDKHPLEHIPNGLSLGKNAVSDSIMVIVEMLITNYSKYVYYATERFGAYNSLFLWYPEKICNVPNKQILPYNL
jgi:hypothetical protein